MKKNIMSKEDKQDFILSELGKRGSVRVSELSEQLNLSSVAIRNTLIEMEKASLLKRTWGGAVHPVGTAIEMSYSTREIKNLSEKAAIAKAAYSFIEEGNTLYIDSGTTTLELVKLLRDEPIPNILIATNAFDQVALLIGKTDIRVIFAGGEVRHNTRSVIGHLTTNAIQQMNFDKVFLGIEHISYEHGLTTPNLPDANLKQTIINSAKQCFVLADYSKFWNDSLINVAVPQDRYHIITDWHITKEESNRFHSMGIKCTIANE